MTIEEMKKRKLELGYSNKELAEKSGVPLGTVQKILAGSTKAPRRETILALERVLAHEKQGELNPKLTHTKREVGEHKENLYPAAEGKNAGMLADPAAAYGKKKLYTVEDYYELPDDQRCELIDGEFFDMSAPTTTHQLFAGLIYKELMDYVLKNKGCCIPMISPVDVQLDCDDKTMVQPDVLVVCDRNKIKNKNVYGAPDLVIEILSPSSRRKDMFLKSYKYSNAGVREYWMVDPKEKKVIVYHFTCEEYPVIYGFEEIIPVGIWDGAYQVNFKAIWDYCSFLYEDGID